MTKFPVLPWRVARDLHRAWMVAVVAVLLCTGAVQGKPLAPAPRPEKLLCAAWSRDRSHWSPVSILRRDCDVPQLAWLGDRLFVYYIRRHSRPRFACSEVLRDRSGGVSLGPLREVTVRGQGRYGLTDPSLLRLSSGKYRLYYVEKWEKGDPARTLTRIRSAVSADGILWRQEGGCRLLGKGVVDPEVVVTADGRYRLYYTQGSDLLAHSAISKDGLHFAPEAGSRVEGGVTSTLRLPSGRYLMVYQSRRQPPRMQAALSDDGLRFRPDPAFRGPQVPGERVRYEAPSLAQMPDGTWLMTFIVTRQVAE